jgi:hypothetical protein
MGAHIKNPSGDRRTFTFAVTPNGNATVEVFVFAGAQMSHTPVCFFQRRFRKQSGNIKGMLWILVNIQAQLSFYFLWGIQYLDHMSCRIQKP